MSITRRELLQAGYSGLLGLSLANARGLAAARKKAKSVIVVFLTGAPSHQDTFDPKPDAPPEIRGEFGTIPTAVTGLRVCEHLPLLAARAHKYTVVRTLAHKFRNHLNGTHYLLTGTPQPNAVDDKAASRDDWPCYAGALDHLRPRTDGIPHGVNLPTYLIEGPLAWPGQHAGFLGARHDPWQITRDPNDRDFTVENLCPLPGLTIDQIADRRKLLDRVNAGQKWLGESAAGRQLSDNQSRAFSVLTSGRMAAAFDLSKEPEKVREKYGRHTFGQSLLLARRLIQTGVSVVQANMGQVQNWDTHENNFGKLKNDLLPPLDRGVSALLDDLDATGLLDETLVLMLGEYGRTPKVRVLKKAPPGRDHWAACFCGVFAGAGVQGGQVLGRSDKDAAYPVTTAYSPDDVGATVYDALGVDPASEIRDKLDRPVPLNRGSVMQALYTGRTD